MAGIKNKLFVLLSGLLIFYSCGSGDSDFDASGAFEADEIIVSAEQMGRILSLNIQEGQDVKAQTVVGQIDVSGLEIQKEQVEASVNAIKNKVNSARPQVDVYQSQIVTQKANIATLKEQLAVLDKEVKRVRNLVKADAAPQKQLDDLEGKYSVLEKQMTSAQAQLDVLNVQMSSVQKNVGIQNRSILSEVEPTQKKIAAIDEQISRGTIKNMFAGTVLAKYANAGEFVTPGKPLYKIADLSTLTLRVYVTGNQLPTIKLNQKVTVRTDDGKGGFKSTEGTISWISDKAEFTPKTVQTKAERANLVYAVKVLVKNDGFYKIGMYGEIKFREQ